MSPRPVRRLASSACCATVLLGIAAPTALAAGDDAARDRVPAAAPGSDADALLAWTGSLSRLDSALEPVTELIEATLEADDGRLAADRVATYRSSVAEAIDRLGAAPAVRPAPSQSPTTPARPWFFDVPGLPQRPAAPAGPSAPAAPSSPGRPSAPAAPSAPARPPAPAGPSYPAVPPHFPFPAVPPVPGVQQQSSAAERPLPDGRPVSDDDEAPQGTGPAEIDEVKSEAIDVLQAAVDDLLVVVSSGASAGPSAPADPADTDVESAVSRVVISLGDAAAVTLLEGVAPGTDDDTAADAPEPAASTDTASILPLLPS
ncbi:hypothetical protein [Streptomyces sp. CRN 30]|uniref:hypothetical protein n=1 Tax=Streptomyces sp. CRN 30 TaxID=3075613 RepID=UPI002A8294BE|nr:hypothetical protein [Streptomyces sp. CRN 30]